MTDGGPRDGLLLFRIAIYFGPPCFVVLTAAWVKLLADDAISLGVFIVLLLLNIPITLAGVEVIYRVVHHSAIGLTKTLLAAGDIPPPPSYPRQDLLIARGQYAEAAEYFRDHIRVDPDDCDARFRLADLLDRYLADPAGAEQQLLDVRRGSRDPRRQFAATNALIDLYRKAGRRDRLKVELGRLADRYRGTPHADAAARELSELKAEGGG